jgi:ABC-type sugar transport system ATPase subunit
VQDDYILKMTNITKTFPGVKALDNSSLHVRRGTVHAVMGENGAGKSTLMKVLLGIYKQDSGDVWFNGKNVYFKGPHDALNDGLAMIHQELSLVRQLTVAENIFLGKELRNKVGLLQKGKMIAETQRLFDELDIDIDPTVTMDSLSVSRQQLCEISKAVSYNAELIIMDEPTSAITETEVDHLFKIIRSLIQKGITIIYITHKMDEIFEIANEVSVYRDSKYIDTLDIKDATHEKIITMMVGRDISDMYKKEQVKIGETLLRVENLSCAGEFENVSFDLRKGEILGFAGLVGSGRSQVVETLFGVRKKSSGKVYINDKEVEIKSPADAIRNKMALLTEDRKFNGCFLPLSVRENIVMAALKDHSKGVFVDFKAADISSSQAINTLGIKTPSLEQKIVYLSGGNQQKVLVGRWLLTHPDILLIDEPTRGIDVGAKSEIYKLLSELAKEGKGIIMVSSELPEILGMSDRVLVMSEGRMTGILDIKDATQHKILEYSTGIVS